MTLSQMKMNDRSPADVANSAILELIAEHSNDVIAQVRPDMTLSYISPSAVRLFRRPVHEVIGHNIAEYVLPEDLPIIADATRRVVSGLTPDVVVTVRVVRGDGTLMWVEVASRLMSEGSGGTPGDRAVIIRDVSERKALEDDLRAMAMKDGLTGLANRRAFDERLSAEWHQTLQEGTQMSLLLADIDHFKRFNDLHGHQVGDDCLRSVSTAISGALHNSEGTVARYGGDEIAIILPAADVSAATHEAERVRVAVEDLRISHGGSDLTVSIGVATALARDGGSATLPHALLAASDRALYEAKAGGRNCVRSVLVMAAA